MLQPEAVGDQGAPRPYFLGTYRVRGAAAGLLWIGAVFSALLPMVPAPAAAQADKPLTLKEAAQKAVLNNPEVLARWHTLKAAGSERDVGAGAFLPKADLSAGSGTERRSPPLAIGSRYNKNSASLTITQLLYDGFATRNEIKRLDHAHLVRLFEFFDTSESVAFEAVRVYYDILRYRELVRLGEENFVQHRSVFDQTERRVKAKVARAVDLEQISARLALAESNLLTETSNLHDATARFQRIVGVMPTQEMPLPAPLVQDIPADAVSAIKAAQQRNGALRAAIENVRASNAALASRSGAYQPRFDLRLRRDQGSNLSGVAGNSDATVAEVVMSWNLFNGFSDRARERQFAEQLNVAKDLRDKTCRDIRQMLQIAYNDVRKVKEQIGYLVQNRVSVEKARNAYRLQFDIGQRTLLDLLDTENELFQAKRAVANAEQDLNVAYARTHAALGTLLAALELSKIETAPLAGLAQWSEGEDASQHCPAEPVGLYVVDKGTLVVRAADLVKQTALLNARERAVLEVLAPASTTAKDDNNKALRQALEGWRAAWSKRDADTYLQFYAPTFVHSAGGSLDAWKEKRKAFLERAADIAVDIADLQVTLPDATHATMVFRQTYRSANYRDVATKTLQWVRMGDRWLIARESAVTLAPGSQ